MRSIAVVGSGFSGTMVAAHLLRAGGVRVTLFEREGRFGPGLAYGTACGAHLLNVPAGRMSALPDAPDDFLRWGQARGHDWTGGTFVPRNVYGRYLSETLDRAEDEGLGILRRVRGEVNGLSASGSLGTAGRPSIEWTEGERARAGEFDAVVLALGNFAPAHPHPDLASLAFDRYARDPWARSALEGIGASDPVLLVGTGLTMLDVALFLDERGHRGPIHAISRRGLLPQPHRSPARPVSYAPPEGIEAWPGTALGILREVRAEVDRAALRGVDWREVISSLRHVTTLLWRSMDERERGRFLRHVRPFWEVVRHRTAPSVDGRIQEMILSGRLVVHAGRIRGVAAFDDCAEVSFTPRGAGEARSMRVARVINCTGPDSDCRRVEEPLIRRLVDGGLARADALGLGLETDEHGSLVTRDGHTLGRVRVIGPLRKARLWEVTAVPELREEALRMARSLASDAASLGRADLAGAC
ncbi:MAG: FAD/NAD(P)-binding protein [Phycisphaerales bacterium]|jgi:uncharacterized NAD(P)/FAD-binding protein YdhS|nr:FAD/NAD(P)-binding protein [Phycisphaerales bacterium]